MKYSTLILCLIFELALWSFSSCSEVEDNGINGNLDKRAYTYVSEYKRLPVYNFGLGKRASPKSMYSFGLGKREERENVLIDGDDEAIDNYDLEKRGKSYDFGLGKRTPRYYKFGLGKKAYPQYSFGLGKRVPMQYNFGLGKRSPKVYSFGIGKKDKVYSFGLGKRYPYFEDEIEEVEIPDYVEEEYNADKRGKLSGQMYGFGLGKRDSFEGEEIKNEFSELENVDDAGKVGNKYEDGKMKI